MSGSKTWCCGLAWPGQLSYPPRPVFLFLFTVSSPVLAPRVNNLLSLLPTTQAAHATTNCYNGLLVRSYVRIFRLEVDLLAAHRVLRSPFRRLLSADVCREVCHNLLLSLLPALQT